MYSYERESSLCKRPSVPTGFRHKENLRDKSVSSYNHLHYRYTPANMVHTRSTHEREAAYESYPLKLIAERKILFEDTQLRLSIAQSVEKHIP